MDARKNAVICPTRWQIRARGISICNAARCTGWKRARTARSETQHYRGGLWGCVVHLSVVMLQSIVIEPASRQFHGHL